MPHSPGIGAIFGIVSENGVAKSGGRVGLYDRTTMALITKTVADSLGGYVFTGLNQLTTDYLVMALDDDGSPAKNALVQDYIQPIPSHMGATFPGNWWLLAMRKDPIALVVPRFAGTPTLAAATVGPFPYWALVESSYLGMQVGSWVAGEPPITPGAPHLPTVRLTSGRLGFPSRHGCGTSYFASPTAEFTLEWVMDTTQNAGLQLLRYTERGGNPDIVGGVIAVKWERDTNKLSAAICHNDGYYGYPQGSLDFTYSQLWRGHTQYVNSGITSGAHHFMWAVRMGVEGKLYLDGNLIATTSLTGETPVPPGGAQKFGMYLSGASPNISLGIATSGPFACYPAKLTQTQVTEHYNALMVGSSPLVTGYIRDVIMDEPSVIFRCNSGTAGTENEFLCGANPGTHYGTLTFANTSPVVGGALTGFGGGVIHNTNGFGGAPGNQQATFEFWINPDTAAPPATRTILAGRYTDEATYNWRINQLITTGKIELLFRNSTPANETVNFNYAPAASTAVLVAIVIDKIAGSARIYENGVLKDTQTVLVGYFANIYQDSSTGSWIHKVLHIGGLRTVAGAISQAFMGKLGEIAIYSTAVGVDRLLSHYNSRTLI